MTPLDIFNYINKLDVECKIASERLSNRIQTSTDVSRFYAVAVTTEEVARFHGVSAARVRDYTDRGLIELHPNSTDAKLLYRLSVVLTLDFDRLKEAKLKLKR